MMYVCTYVTGFGKTDHIVISRIACIRGWAGGRGVGWVEGVGGKPEAGYTVQLDCLG